MPTHRSPATTRHAEAATPSPRKLPQQARARQTVEAIFEAAAEVFEAEGFEAATMERIVARAGVSVGSMYQYFPNKAALWDALMQRYADDVQALQAEWLRGLAQRPSIEVGLAHLVDWLVAAHAVRPALRCLMFERRPLPTHVHAAMNALHASSIEGLERWLTGDVIDPRRTAIVLHQTVSSLVHQFVLHPHPELPVDHAAAEVLKVAQAYLQASR